MTTTERQLVLPGAAVITEGKRSFFVSSPMVSVESDREVAWEGAKELVTIRPDWGWTLSRYVSFGPEPNQNGHIFGLEDAELIRTVVNTPLNMGHANQYIVGSNVACAVLYPTDAEPDPTPATARSMDYHPWAEVLSNFYRGIFPDEYRAVQAAQRSGSSWISMEAVPEFLHCQTAGCCDVQYPYEGLRSEAYCDSLNKPASRKKLVRPFYIGAGVILPPQRPGWRGADLATVAKLGEEAERVYDAVAQNSPHLTTAQIEAIMAALLLEAADEGPSVSSVVLWAAEEVVYDRKFSAEKRRQLADKGQALPDGSYPIENVSDLRNAIRLANAGHGNVAAAKRLIIRMARRFDRPDLLPEAWKVSAEAHTDHLVDRAQDADAVLEKMVRSIPSNIQLGYPPGSIAGQVKTESVVAAEMAAETGVIVAIVPPAEIREKLAELGREPADEIHLTLAFCGDDKGGEGTLTDPVKADEVVTIDRLSDVVQEVAAAHEPLHAKVSGMGKFVLDDSTEATYASVDAPGLPQLFTALVTAMDAAGIPRSRIHGLSPHMTMKYSAAGGSWPPMPPLLEWDVTSLWVWWGPERREFPIGGG